MICSTLVKSVPKISKSEKKPTAKVPQTPAPKCTGTAPTTSSISYLFNNSLIVIATKDPIIPTKIETNVVIELQPAVIATNPASGPRII